MQIPSDTASPRGPEVMGRLLRAAADLPRQPSTDALLTQALLQADLPAFQSPEFRAGVAAYLASARNPGDDEARARDAAQWEALLADPLGQQLLGDPRLTPEQRLAHASFFLLRPVLPLELLSLYGGQLTRVAAHEALLTLQTFELEQVAPIARLSEGLAQHFPVLADLPRPVDAQALAALVPHALSPEQAARTLELLVQDLTWAVRDDSPLQEHLKALVGAAVEGLRTLIERLRTETEPQQVAQALVLGALQHEAFTQVLPPFTAVDGGARELVAPCMGHLGMALGGPVGAAAAGMLTRSVFRAVDGLCAGGRLPLGALAGEVLGVPGLGLAPHALGEVTAALTQLYAAQLSRLGAEATDLLDDELSRLLFQGEVEGLGAAWTALLTDPERLSALQRADAPVRAEVLRVLLVGGAVGAFPWDAVAPALQAHGPALFGHSLSPDTPATSVAMLYAASAARAVAVLGNDELVEPLSTGTISPAEALVEAREHGAGLFAGGLDPADPTLTAAMLGALVPAIPAFEPAGDDVPGGFEG